jgi:hypothetical protein
MSGDVCFAVIDRNEPDMLLNWANINVSVAISIFLVCCLSASYARCMS